MFHRHFTVVLVLVLGAAAGAADAPNLLRNGTFQDDWITRIPQVKNHHYCFSSEHYNRRDGNPDGWECQGSWDWPGFDDPAAPRPLRLAGPTAEASQRLNWVLIYDDRQLVSFADAGRFPALVPVRSKTPLALVRDLKLRARIRAQAAVADAGVLELALCPPGGSSFQACGSPTPPTTAAAVAVPPGIYDWRWLEVTLPAARWLAAVTEAAAKDPREQAALQAEGPVLPGSAKVTLRYAGPTGQFEVAEVELTEPGPPSPNLLADGGFEEVDGNDWPRGWALPEKYTWFPPGNYYLFNTWHNTTSPNRGPVQPDALVPHRGQHSLKMIIAAGDEKSVTSAPAALKQREPRLIEAQAWVKTDRLCMLQLDAEDEKGQRLDGHLFIHKAQVSIGTNEWRLIRQVWRPRAPVAALRVKLCARGVNGYTLADTCEQPQNNVVGTIWWDDVAVFEPESTAAELAARGVAPARVPGYAATPYLTTLDLGERLLGQNELRATVRNPGPATTLGLRWVFRSPGGQNTMREVWSQQVAQGQTVALALPYVLSEPCPCAYTEYQGTLQLLQAKNRVVASTELWFGTWTTPVLIRLGNLYLLPEQRLPVRLNLGLTTVTMARAAKVRLEVVRRGTGAVVQTVELPATPAAIAAQRTRLPAGLRDDLTNLLLTDLDVSALPVQPFNYPERGWLVRATVLATDGTVLASGTSAPFCRQAHAPPQPPIRQVTISPESNVLLINGQPWLPWGACYGHQPVYDGPADPGPGNYLDLHRLPEWSIYDRFGAGSYTRSRNDLSCLRYVAASVTPQEAVEKAWKTENLYAATVFPVGQPVYSLADLAPAQADNKSRLDAVHLQDYLTFCRMAPMVVATTPGIEEAFGLFHELTPAQLQGLEQVVRYLRAQTGKPVMVGHGGYWNRFEWEKAPFFDIYDPETEPLYPANLHTDLMPLIRGQAKVGWLRPQMYESVPYERWRFHVYVELLRGCRGWQIAHGSGDQSLFRGLHGELEYLAPTLAGDDPGPAVTITPWLEHRSWRHAGKTYLIAASTHGLALGNWHWTEVPNPPRRLRVTEADSEFRSDANNYGIDAAADRGLRFVGLENLPDSRVWPTGSTLSQWVRLDREHPPQGLVVLVKADGRWTCAGAWGKADLAPLRKDPARQHWFLSCFYRNAQGFAFTGWYGAVRPSAVDYIPAAAAPLGALPPPGEGATLEVPLAAVNAVGKLVDGVAFLHEQGNVAWGPLTIKAPDGTTSEVWGDSPGLPPEALAKTRITVAGVKAGTAVKVLFEDRQLRAEDGFFTDDFRGQDLYQRFGGGPCHGYGDTPVAFHVYELAGP